MISLLERKINGKAPSGHADFQDCITAMENLLMDDINPDKILQIISLFSQGGPFYENAIDDGDDIVPFELFSEKNTLVISITFSALGMIDIVAVSDESATRIQLITESTDAADSIRQDLPSLYAELADRKSPIIITVTDRHSFLEEIDEYRTSLSRGVEINIQV
jgi:hypothetical protein